MAEGVAAVIDSARGRDGTIFVQSATVPTPVAPPAGTNPASAPARRSPGPWAEDAPATVPQVSVSVEHYNRMVRIIKTGVPVKMDLDFKCHFVKGDGMGYNTVAELPGSDKKDEVVMVGGHMDSWHSGTGATDNAAGVVVAMEAVRILKAAGLQPRRTVRVALWSGEEQGLFGSRAYVAQHFGTRQTGADGTPSLVAKPEHSKISAYFNLDNGTGKIRGIYQQSNAKVGPIFADWLKPFADMGASTVTIRNTGSTDHVSFDGVGIPGFQFIQDTIEYDSRTHHSNQDVYDRIQMDDLKQAAVIMATFLYQAANRDELLPRKGQ
jgi:Zn-dependent M28 family amino/carboxypeptidase